MEYSVRFDKKPKVKKKFIQSRKKIKDEFDGFFSKRLENNKANLTKDNLS